MILFTIFRPRLHAIFVALIISIITTLFANIVLKFDALPSIVVFFVTLFLIAAPVIGIIIFFCFSALVPYDVLSLEREIVLGVEAAILYFCVYGGDKFVAWAKIDDEEEEI